MSLIFHGKMNGDANDATGNGHHGAPTDVSFVPGKIRQAASFNGTSSLVHVADDPAISGLPSFTVALWIKWNALSDHDYCIGKNKGTSARPEWHLGLDASSPQKFRFKMYRPSEWSDSIVSDAGIVVGQWYHVAMVRGGASFYMYVDGVQQADTGSLAAGTYDSDGELEIGNVDQTAGRWVAAAMDDIRIYDEALPLWKIKKIFNFGRGTEEIEPWQRAIERTIEPLVGV